MRSIAKNLVSFLKKEDGPTAVEYAVMLALIIVVCIAAITAIGTSTNSTFSSVGSALGILAWGAGWASWLPLTGVHKAPWTQRTPRVLLPVIDHAVFGAVWGLLYRRHT